MSAEPKTINVADLALWQIRVMEEWAELRERHAKLTSFMESAAFGQLVSPEEQILLTQQRDAMHDYGRALSRRVDGWFK